MESAAVINLLTKISPAVVDELRRAVRTRGMRTWISNTMIAREIFNVGYSSALNTPYEKWGCRLTNGQDDALEPRTHFTARIFGSIVGKRFLC